MENIYDTTDKCPACNGSGVQYSHTQGLRVTCPVCNGTGRKKRRGFYNPSKN
jgi:DnaJ-class molecular chaperone